ncbi:hypothetical protein PG991_009297 [Apiospora marii]|uniref:SUN domain-containing protein n=1 Tax=Apiospora marii TaxID=335849 RepID=A0ABR1RKA3_9PEZI
MLFLALSGSSANISPAQISFESSADSMASPPSLEPPPLGEVEASDNPPNLADPSDEAIHNPETFVGKAAVKVSWAVSTSTPISTSSFISTSPSPSTSTHNTTSSQDATLHLRYEPGRSEAYLALRFPRTVLQEKNKNRSHAFFVFFAPEVIISLLFCDSGNSYHLDVRLGQPPGLVGPDCPWMGREGSEVDLERIRTLGLEVTACTISVLPKDAKKAQLELFCAAVSKGLSSIKRYYNIQSLYGGKGGRRCGPSHASCPPEYSQVLDVGADGSQGGKAGATALDGPPLYRALAVAGSSQNTEEAAGKPFVRPSGFGSATPQLQWGQQLLVLDDIMSQLSHLTETVQRLTERMDGVESRIAAEAQMAGWKGEFVEKDDLVETVAAQVDSEMDGVSDHLEQKLKEHLVEYLDNELEEKEEEILEAVADKICSARLARAAQHMARPTICSGTISTLQFHVVSNLLTIVAFAADADCCDWGKDRRFARLQTDNLPEQLLTVRKRLVKRWSVATASRYLALSRKCHMRLEARNHAGENR